MAGILNVPSDSLSIYERSLFGVTALQYGTLLFVQGSREECLKQLGRSSLADPGKKQAASSERNFQTSWCRLLGVE